jgi:hypothetical protein
MTNPTADDVDDAVSALLLLGLNYEATKLSPTERARLTWALSKPSGHVEEVLDEAATALVEQLAECLAFVLNHTALEPDKRDA